MRANLSDLQKNLDDFKMRLTYQTPTETELHEKRRETFEGTFEGTTNWTLGMLSRVQEAIGISSSLTHTISRAKMRSARCCGYKITAGTQSHS